MHQKSSENMDKQAKVPLANCSMIESTPSLFRVDVQISKDASSDNDRDDEIRCIGLHPM